MNSRNAILLLVVVLAVVLCHKCEAFTAGAAVLNGRDKGTLSEVKNFIVHSKRCFCNQIKWTTEVGVIRFFFKSLVSEF